MPVSRKRKKKPGKSGRPRQPARVDQRGSAAELSGHDRRELAAALQGMAVYREQVQEGRGSRATAAATDLVTDLVTVAANQPDVIVEDALCLRLGTLLSESERDPIDERPGPDHLASALVTAAAAAVEATTGDADAWRAPWQVLTAVAGILPYPHGETVAEEIRRLRDSVVARVPLGPTVTGPVRWTRDRYGSRFAVTAPITTADRPARWYLWDIDACGHQAHTVHSGYYPTPEAALTAWQTGVGPTAAAGTELAPVDDPRLLSDLLPAIEGFLRVGGENAEQFAEYHRSRRLAEVVKEKLRQRKTRPNRGLDAATAAAEFTTWLRARAAEGQQLPEDLDEFVTELADSWCINEIDAVYATCSPHRVALCVQHVRGYYLDDFAEQLVTLLPDWIRWLAARNSTPSELADRCLPYAEGKPHPQITGNDKTEADYLARVIE
ncbi:hypothetical protein [Actinophytocola sp.]|uniref:hypothetical protein n=1 Tax=Actinophytocola sp. TaxID=1872138 RepID=UPI002ED621E7